MFQEIENILNVLNTFDKYDVLKQKIKPLTAAGENYGSIMLSVEITLKNKKSLKEKVLKTVAKLIPHNEFMQKVFNSQVSFKSEIGFYEIILPTLQNFRRKFGIGEMDMFAHSYGSRINLNGSDVVDENGILILENLKERGYTMYDRMRGLNLTTAKVVVKELAGFHATSLALKLTHPVVFSNKIKPYFNPFTLLYGEWKKMFDAWESTLKEDPETAKLLPKILPKLERQTSYKPREPFVTLAHTDLWINNIMIKKHDKTEKVKFVDFQFPDYKSPVADLIFFLFSSVSTDVLTEYLDYLLEYFYFHLVEMLSKLKCEIPFLTWDFFLKELETEAQVSEICHIAFMTLIIFASKEVVKEVNDYDEKAGVLGKISHFQKEKILFFTKEFARRNWI